jgi:hypothetical protein
MGIWATLFGNENVIKKAADGIYNGVDAAFYTNEEKASGFLNLLKGYEPFKIAQRLLMLVVTIPYVLIWVLCALLIMSSGFVASDTGAGLIEAAKVTGAMNNDTLGIPVSLVVAFYFGGGALEGVVGRMRAKKE